MQNGEGRMLDETLSLDVIQGDQLTELDRAAIIDLCSQAYSGDYAPYLKIFVDPVHVLARLDGMLVSHALWITRWLQVNGDLMLRTAYVEAVATEEAYRERGLATRVMERLAAEIVDFDIGALCPAETSLYARLGWEFWQGPLFTRAADGLVPNPDEAVMILRLPNTPELDLSLSLSVEWREGEVW
jgi:aminoglycoside 2'-N-acetyltransferase I